MTIEAMKKLVAAVEAIPEDVEGWMPDALTDALIDAKKSIAEAEKQELVALVSKTPPLYPMQKEGETFSVEYYEIDTQPKRERVVFPTMLRKMWSGGEVQAWIDENVNKEKNT